MRTSRPACLLLLVATISLTSAPARPAAPQGGGGVRIVGPNGEAVPVLNENGAPIRLEVVGARRGRAWRSDTPQVATVDNRGTVTPGLTGFATISADTPAGEAKCFVAVMRVSSQGGGIVQGDAKSDRSGTLYLSDPVHHVIVRAVGRGSERWVGAADQPGFRDGQGAFARFAAPSGLAVDLSTQGGLYVADSENHCVRKVGFDGRVGSSQRSSVVAGEAGQAGTTTGQRSVPLDELRLSGPRGVVSLGGDLIVADTANHCLWYAEVGRGRAWLLAGQPGEAGLEDGEGEAARFGSPAGIAVNTRGNLLAVADAANGVVRLVRLRRGEDDGPVGHVSTLGVASSGKVADVAKAMLGDDPADAIRFDGPRSVSLDGVENVYVVDAVGAYVVTRPEGQAPRVVALAQAGSLGTPLSVTTRGRQVYVLDGAAADEDEAVRVIEVGAPVIEGLSVEAVGLGGGAEVVVTGQNFAPETVVTYAEVEVTDFEVVSAREIRLRVPAVAAPGNWTLTVTTRGGSAQRALVARAKQLAELAPGEITTVAGGVQNIGDGGSALQASIKGPRGAAVDAAGNLFVADTDNHRVRRVDAATGLITTVAGTGVFGYNGDGRLATTARLAQPNGLEVDASGNLFIVDTANQRIRRVDAATGLITTVAGTGELGYNGDRRPATEAKFYFPMSVAFDAAGNLFISDWGNNRVRRVDAATGLITTVAGTGVAGNNGSEGPATTTRLYGPQGIAFDAAGNLFITDSGNHRVRRVNAQTKRMTTVAGGSGGGPYDGDNKPATQARLWSPDDVAVDAAGNLFIADFGNNRIRRVSAQTGLITTVAGTGAYGYNGEGIAATAARLAQPTSVVLDAAGDLFIANLTLGNEYADDLGVSRVRRVDARSNLITTVAGTSEFASDGDEQLATAARMSPQGVAIDAEGNLFISDTGYHRIRRVDAATGMITIVAGTGAPGSSGDGRPAIIARLANPRGIAVDASGNLFIADTYNSRIRRVDAATGVITTIAGTGVQGFNGDRRPATSAHLSWPTDVAVDAAGNLFIADTSNDRVRRVDSATGMITTVAGTGVGGFNGDGQAATAARLSTPWSVTIDAAGNLFVADTSNHRVRRVDAATGLITTVAGTGVAGYNGDEQLAAAAQLWFPNGVAVDAAGNLFVADASNNRVRRIDAVTGRIATVAGTEEFGYTGDDGPAVAARLAIPTDVTFDAEGNLYIADWYSAAIRAVRAP